MHDLWRCSQLPNPKPLASLDNPWPFTKNDSIEGLATCVKAFQTVDKHHEGLEGGIRKLVLPVSDLNWNLIATTGAITAIHKDSDGAGTMVRSVQGLKAWAMIRNSGQHSPRKFLWSRIYEFLQLDRADGLRNAELEVEILLLRLTDMLYVG